MSSLWLQLDFVRDLYIAICKDTGDIVQKEGVDWLLNAIKRSALGCLGLRSQRVGHITSLMMSKRLDDSGLKALDLYDNCVRDGGLQAILRYSERNVSLQMLCAGGCDLGSEGFTSVADYIASKKSHLEVLELGTPSGKFFQRPSAPTTHHNRIGLQQLSQIAKALADNKCLQYLGLGDLEFCLNQKPDHVNHATQALGASLARNQCLLGLDLSNNFLGDIGVQPILKGLQQNRSISHLNLSSNGLTHQAVPLLSTVVSAQFCGLTSLNLSKNNLGPAGAKSLAFGLTLNRSLQSIHLEDCQLGDEGASIICKVLSLPLDENDFNKSLTEVTGQETTFDQSDKIFQLLQEVELDVQNDSQEKEIVIIDHTGMEINKLELSKVSKNSQTLTKLQQTQVSQIYKSYGLTSMKLPTFSQYTQIQSLNLAENGFGAKTATYICQLLASPAKIKCLNVSRNRLGLEGSMQIASALVGGQIDFQKIVNQPKVHQECADKSKLLGLQTLSMAQTGVNDEGFVALSFALSLLPDITSVNFSDNYIGERGGDVGAQHLLQSQSIQSVSLLNNQVSHTVIVQLDEKAAANKERITQAGPLQTKREIEQLGAKTHDLPSLMEQLTFLKDSAAQISALVNKVTMEADDNAATFSKMISNLQTQAEQTQTAIQKTYGKKDDADAVAKELVERQQSNRATLKQLLDTETQAMQAADAELKAKEEQLEQLKTNSKQVMEEKAAQIKAEEKAVQKVAEAHRLALKLIDNLKLKYNELVTRVQASSGVQMMAYAIVYEEVVNIIQRMHPLSTGQVTIQSQPVGYDFDKAVIAGNEGKKKVKAK